MKKDLNILEFCLSPDLGGLELFMINCFKNFKQKTNCKIIVEKNTKLDAYLENNGQFHLKRNKLFPIIPALKLAKYIDSNNIDIIHFHWTKDITTVVLAKVLSQKKPKIMQTRNMTMTRFKNDFYHKWLYENISTMHAVTFQVKEQLKKFIPKDVCPKIEMIYMGTQENSINHSDINILKEKYQLNSDDFIVGIVGRIQESKGQYLVIEAIKNLNNPNIKALIVGHTMDESYLSNLKQEVKNLKLEKQIIFTGFTKSVNEHMKLFDTNILATPHETFGLVVIEAMMNQVCMIATNKGGPLEIIEENVDGLLFDRTNEDLALKINLLYSNKKYKNELAQKGYEKAKIKFNSTAQLEKLYSVMEQMK
jgi:glycosyltransferase involved in cell wall biosynthesis